MSSSAERAAERIEHIPSCPAGCKLTTEEGSFTRKEIIAAIIAEEYAELIKAASQAIRQWEMYADDERNRNEELALRDGDDMEAKMFQNCERVLAHAEGK